MNGLVPKHILAVKTHAMGDVLMTTPALRALRRAFPDARIEYLTGSWSAPAIRDNPNIQSLIEVPDDVFHKRRLRSLIRVIKTIRSKKFDLAVLFQPSRAVVLMTQLARIPKIAGLYKDRYPMGLDLAAPWRRDRNRYVVEDFLDVVRLLGVESSDLSLEFSIPQEIESAMIRRLAESDLKVNDYMVVCPGGARNPRDFVRQKLWPLNDYCCLLQQLQHSGIRIVVAGSDIEADMLKPVTDLPGIINFVGRTTVPQLASLVKQSRLLLTNDSAPMHLALAVDCPFVALFGPSRYQAVLPESGHFQVVHADISCAPCYDNEPFGCCERMDCIRSVRVDRVRDAILDAWVRWKK